MAEIIDIYINEPVTLRFPQIEKEYMIGELSLKQVIRMAKWVLQLTSNMTNTELKSFETEKNNVKSLMKLIELADSELVYNFLGIVLNEEDEEILKKLATISIISKIIELLASKNNMGEIFANFQKAVTILKSGKPLKATQEENK